VAYRLWVNGVAISMNATTLYFLSTSIMSCQLKWGYGHRIACSCRFPGWPLDHICSMEIMVPQEGETVPSDSGGMFWRPCHIGVYDYCGLVLDRRQSYVR
jgi:hypothetical protein